MGISYPHYAGITYPPPPNAVENLSTTDVYNSNTGFLSVDSVENLSTVFVDKKGTVPPRLNVACQTILVSEKYHLFLLIQVKRAANFQTHFCTFLRGCPQFCPIYPRFKQVTGFLASANSVSQAKCEDAPCVHPAPVLWTMWKTYPPLLWTNRHSDGCFVDSVENLSTDFVDN